MDQSVFLPIYLCMTGGYAVASVTAFMGKSAWSRFTGSVGSALNVLLFFLIILSAHRLPIFGVFESVTTLTLILGLLHLSSLFTGNTSDRLIHYAHSKWIYVSIVLLLIYLAFFPKAVNEDFYMYDNIRVVVFFNFRIVSCAVFLYSALTLCAALYHGFPGYIHMGRNFLLAGAAIFLISEFSGSLWCLSWWGDSWHWSKGFLKASSLFLPAMMACHVPPSWNLSRCMQGIIGSIPAAGSLWLIFLH